MSLCPCLSVPIPLHLFSHPHPPSAPCPLPFGLYVPWWRHQMETVSALLALRAGNSPVPVISPHKGQWRAALMFSVIYAWINDWVNSREAGDLRRHRGHYDVIVIHTPNPIYLPTFPECVGVCGTCTAFIMQLQTHLHCFLHDFMLYFLFEEQRTCCVFDHDKSAPHIESCPNICLLSHFDVLFVAPLMFYPITPSCRNSHNNHPIMWLPARHMGHNRRLTPRACRHRVIETSEVLIGKEPRSRLVLQYEGM